MISKDTLNSIWNYYLSLERDLDDTSRYIEPRGQEKVHSFEFAKLLVLSCTELESVLKIICFERTGETKGNFGQYKETILTNYPNIVFAEVYISRLSKTIRPFEGWDTGKLSWWSAYVNVKHNREKHFSEATYQNVIYALSALYVSIFYLSRITSVEFADYKSTYIQSNYASQSLVTSPEKKLPDFTSHFQPSSNPDDSASRNVKMLFCGSNKPLNGKEGDIWLQIDDDSSQ